MMNLVHNMDHIHH